MESATTATDRARARLVQEILDVGAVAVIRMTDAHKLMQVAEAILKGGLAAIEVTMTVPKALEMIAQVAEEMGDALTLGVGSVTDAETAHQAIDAGARYVVSPVFKPEVIEAAHARGCPVMPGAYSPTEILAAQEQGADVVKVFPAEIVGMGFIKAVKAPMPHLRLMPTGGVTPENAGDWIRAGASAVGVGSALLDKKAIAEGRYEVLTQNARTLLQSIAEARSR